MIAVVRAVRAGLLVSAGVTPVMAEPPSQEAMEVTAAKEQEEAEAGGAAGAEPHLGMKGREGPVLATGRMGPTVPLLPQRLPADEDLGETIAIIIPPVGGTAALVVVCPRMEPPVIPDSGKITTLGIRLLLEAAAGAVGAETP
jgi:hypothetical protein